MSLKYVGDREETKKLGTKDLNSVKIRLEHGKPKVGPISNYLKKNWSPNVIVETFVDIFELHKILGLKL